MTDIRPPASPPLRRRYDLIAFDWDGTLFDSTKLIARCIQAACRDLGLPVPADTDAAYVIGLGLGDAMRHVAPTLDPARMPDLGGRYRHHYLARQHELVLFDGTLEMLQALKQRQHFLGVATGKNRQGLDHALAQSQLHRIFDATRTADETASKPHPRMLLELMAALGVPPERTLMIGDTTHDLMLAANAGTDCIGVAYGAHDHGAFEAHRPRFVAHSTAELHRWLIDNG